MKCPTGKVRHHNKEGACIHASKFKNNRLNVFRCAQCGGWHIGNSNSPFRIQKRLDQIFARDKVRAASADTHPKDGDVEQAPLVSGAVPKADAHGESA